LDDEYKAMILIKNSQKRIIVDVSKVEKNAKKLLEFLSVKDFDLGLLFTTNATIRKYNKQYRKKDKATDILSFPYHTELKVGQKIRVKNPEDKNLGDIIISVEFANKDAQAEGITLSKHLNVLLVHGIAHLLGYDHETEKDFMIMDKFEQRLLTVLGSKN
jgi:probable rRNA maturation factor